MKQISRLGAIVLAIVLVAFAGCKKSENNSSSSSSGGGGSTTSDVRVTTYTPQNITGNSAVCGGDVIVTQGLSLTEIGVCWNTEGEPMASDNYLSTEVWNEPFVCTMTSLSPATTYYVRAYATNEIGTAYGNEVIFRTDQMWHNGILPGSFSINETQQVHFSQGNLQYQATTNTWRFAKNQWDIIGYENSNISENYNGWIDLFGWATSGYNHGAVCYQPWSTSYENSYYYAYGSYTYNLNDQTGMADWGYNAISNGGNTTNTWRTLTGDEWVYVFYTRSTASRIRYAKAQVNGKNGVILLPDDWNESIYYLEGTNTGSTSFTTNIIIAENWSRLETAGAVFLPAAGYRYETGVNDVGSYGGYWSASAAYENGHHALYVYFDGENLNFDFLVYPCCGQSVRLVCPAEN